MQLFDFSSWLRKRWLGAGFHLMSAYMCWWNFWSMCIPFAHVCTPLNLGFAPALTWCRSRPFGGILVSAWDIALGSRLSSFVLARLFNWCLRLLFVAFCIGLWFWFMHILEVTEWVFMGLWIAPYHGSVERWNLIDTIPLQSIQNSAVDCDGFWYTLDIIVVDSGLMMNFENPDDSICCPSKPWLLKW